LVGFVSYLVLLCCEKATAGYRARLLPTHVSMGLVIYGLAIAACLTGLIQTARSRLGYEIIIDKLTLIQSFARMGQIDSRII